MRKPSRSRSARIAATHDEPKRGRPSTAHGNVPSHTSTRLLIVCGGRQTEKRYLTELRRSERNPAVTVTIRTNPRSPADVVAYADRLNRQNPGEYEEVWGVFDVDEFQNVVEAVRLAGRKRIKVAVSNPCFELWLLLHFCDHTAHIRSYAALLPLLRAHLPRYDKSRLDFADFREGVLEACGRARNLDPTGQRHEVNPSTSVWRVVEKVRGTR